MKRVIYEYKDFFFSWNTTDGWHRVGASALLKIKSKKFSNVIFKFLKLSENERNKYIVSEEND